MQPQEEPQIRRRRNPISASIAWLWNRYSPNGEFPLSSLASTAFHVLILILIPLLAMAVTQPETTPPAVSTVRVSDDSEAARGEGDEATPGDVLQAGDPNELKPSDTPPQTIDAAKVEEVQEFQPSEKGATQQERQQKTQENVEKAKKAAQNAASAVADAKARLAKNLGKKAGGGGNGAKGRAARPSRWILAHPEGSIEEHLAEYEGLGATLAFPSQGEKWRFFANPSSEPRKSELKDLESESRLYWVNDEPRAVSAVANALGLPSANLYTMFLPKELEEKMLKLELAYKNLEEEDILSTRFEIVKRGSGYEVIVVHQIAK
jgi:hypothetical protein